MPKYPVKEALSHDGQDYAPGDTVELTEEQAAPLLPLGVVGRPAREKDKGAE